jgi:hypothetical protein
MRVAHGTGFNFEPKKMNLAHIPNSSKVHANLYKLRIKYLVLLASTFRNSTGGVVLLLQ